MSEDVKCRVCGRPRGWGFRTGDICVACEWDESGRKPKEL